MVQTGLDRGNEYNPVKRGGGRILPVEINVVFRLAKIDAKTERYADLLSRLFRSDDAARQTGQVRNVQQLR